MRLAGTAIKKLTPGASLLKITMPAGLGVKRSSSFPKSLDQPKKRKKPVFEKSHVEIDRESTLPDGVTVDGIEELKNTSSIIADTSFAKGLTVRMLAYALSRDIDYHDEDLVNHLVESFEQNDYSVPILIREIVKANNFGEDVETMAVKSWHLQRRAFLRGAGVSLALPFMNAMAVGGEQQALQALPKRAAFIFFPNGVSLPQGKRSAT